MSARSRTCRRVALGLACLLTLLWPVAAGAVQSHSSLSAIERQVMCVTCKIPLNVAESPQANEERAFISELIERGDSEAQIKRALVSQYGASVLALPPAHGFDLAAYLVPILVMLALLGLLAALLPSWRRRARSSAVAPAPALDPADAARVERDMSRFDR